MEGGELVSHSKMWRVAAFPSSAFRPARVEGERERDVAIMVFSASCESCVTNSRPRPRLAPVMSQVGILAVVRGWRGWRGNKMFVSQHCLG